MIERGDLASAFARNVEVLKLQAEGLTHEESLLQPPFRGNCMNWVLGHIAHNRGLVLDVLKAEHLPEHDRLARYARESEAITSDEQGALPLQELLATLDQQQARTGEALLRATDAELARTTGPTGRQRTVASAVFFLYFHETYHVGQAELLRQLAGKNDKVI
jgi:uncharacterized damage-inducible protein DinB